MAGDLIPATVGMEAEFAWRKNPRIPADVKTHFTVMLLLLRLQRQREPVDIFFR